MERERVEGIELEAGDHVTERRGRRSSWVALLEAHGWEAVLEELEAQCPGLELYSVSKDWSRSADFILKAKGGRGDILVFWELEERGAR